MNDADSLSSDHAGVAAPRLAAEIETLGHRMAMVRERVGRIIFGQQDVIDQTLITLLAGGHALLVGFPGLGKTRLVETLGGIVIGNGYNAQRGRCQLVDKQPGRERAV